VHTTVWRSGTELVGGVLFFSFRISASKIVLVEK